MERTALYLRLSKEDVGKEREDISRSIENQRKILEEYAAGHQLVVVGCYIDDDYSGLSWERPSFIRMLEAAAKHEFTVILAKSQSRLSRNMEHTEYLLHHLFPQLGIRFLGVVDGVDSARRESKKARQINALVNEWYSEDLSDSIRAVYRRKMQEGEYLGAYAPYGYRKSSADSHRLEICERQAVWVKRMYDRYQQGASVQEIRLELIKNHVATPTAERRGEKDYQWSASTIKKILSNEVYTGAVVQGKSKRESFKEKHIVACPRESWIVAEGMHQPIITKKQYEMVKELRKSRNKK